MARLRSQWSASTSATMASATGTARGQRHGSWRPCTSRSTPAPSLVTECWDLLIDDGGCTARRKTKSSPFQLRPSNPPPAQPMASKYERHHGYRDRYSARAETWIMAPMHFEVISCTILGHRMLGLTDRRRRLHSQADDDIFAIRDPAQHAARMVGPSTN